MANDPQAPDVPLDATDVRPASGETDAGSDQTHLRPATPEPEPGTVVPVLPLPVVAEEHYDVGAEVARGGLGKILKAFDRRLKREVALKVLRVRKPDAEARFLREAMVTARLQHPAIVPVYEAGVWPDGEPFYAMKLVSGKSLAELIHDRPALNQRLALLPNVIAVADAMAYAHEHRVIHRDLKPHNVMVGEFGETVVIDWGLAKSLDGPSISPDGNRLAETPQILSGETMVGSVLGTPAYMPPEQARGERVDQRADVYAIGAVLYHLLRGKMPFSELASPADALRRVMLGPPPDIEQVAEGIPEDLAAIVHKAMAARVEDRYPSARELAADLRRFQTGQLVSVRQYRTREVFYRWFLRHRPALLTALVAMLVLMVGGAISVVRVFQEKERALAARAEAVSARNKADEARGTAETARAAADGKSNELMLVQATTALERDPTAALAWLSQHPGGGALPTMRTLASDAVARGVAAHVFRRHDGRVIGLGFGPSAESLVSCGVDGRLLNTHLGAGTATPLVAQSGILWQLARLPGGNAFAVAGGGTPLRIISPAAPPRPLALDDPQVLALAVSRDGAQVAAGTVRGGVWLWDLASGERRALPAHPHELRDLAFSADGKRLASVSFDGTIHVVELATLASTTIPPADSEQVLALAFSPDGTTVAAGGKDGVVRLWNSQGRLLHELRGHHEPLTQIAFSPDGRLLASAGRDRTVRVWGKPWGESRAFEGHTASVIRLAWSPDGRQLASSGADMAVRLWDVETGDGRLFAGHEATQSALAFSDDGARLASAGQDGSVRVWNLTPQGEHVARAFTQVTLSPRGTTRVGVAIGGLVAIDASGTASARIARGTNWKNLAFLDEDQMLAVGADGEALWLKLSTGEQKRLGHLEAEIGDAAIASGWVVAGGYDGKLYLWHLPDGAARVVRAHRTYTLAVVASPDGQWVATGGEDGDVNLWNVATWTPQALPKQAGPVHRVRFSDDGRLLASGDMQGNVRVWDVAAKAVVAEEHHRGFVRALAFSRDGAWLASSGDDKTVRVRRLSTGEVRVFTGPRQSVFDLAFSPDAALLAVASADAVIRVYELSTGAARVLRGHAAGVTRVVFSPDGEALESLDSKGAVWGWPRSEWSPLPWDRRGLEAWVRAATDARIDSDHRPTSRP